MKSTCRQLCSSEWPTVKAPHWIPSFFCYVIFNFASDISKVGQFYKKMHSKNKEQLMQNRGVPKYRYYDIPQCLVLRYVIDTLAPNIDI